MGNKYRGIKYVEIFRFHKSSDSFGKENYFSAMNLSELLLDTSSGILEAASFGKFVVNVGDRQKEESKCNIINTAFNTNLFYWH